MTTPNELTAYRIPDPRLTTVIGLSSTIPCVKMYLASDVEEKMDGLRAALWCAVTEMEKVVKDSPKSGRRPLVHADFMAALKKAKQLLTT